MESLLVSAIFNTCLAGNGSIIKGIAEMIKCLLKKTDIFNVLCRAIVNIVLKIEPNRINILEGHLKLTEKILCLNHLPGKT